MADVAHSMDNGSRKYFLFHHKEKEDYMLHPNKKHLGEKNQDARSLLLSKPFEHLDDTNEPNVKQIFPEIIAKSPVMITVLKSICKIAKSSSAVLILGESGTGKELIAAAIHRLSSRGIHNYVAINCSAIPEDLLEAELFGHEKGAFTGADKKRSGYFGIANHGTIFLDEIGDMPARLQAKLLRVLQEKKYSSVGSHEVKESDVRVIAATNVNLEQAVKEGRFRLDLYYRLNVLPVILPPLRQRRTDIPFLLEHFLDRANYTHCATEPCWLSDEVMDCLTHYNWPGNVRELQNLVERLIILKGSGAVQLKDLPTEYKEASIKPLEEMQPIQESFLQSFSKETNKAPQQQTSCSDQMQLPIDLTSFIENLENNLIKEALKRTQNNKNQAARLLGLNRTTLVERIKKRGIESHR